MASSSLDHSLEARLPGKRRIAKAFKCKANAKLDLFSKQTFVNSEKLLSTPVRVLKGSFLCFQYLQKRFGTAARIAGSIAFQLQLLLYSGVVLYAPAIALEATTGISTTASVVGIGLVCTFYSTIGGIKAVLITDVFQSLLMLVAVILVIVTAAVNVGSLGRIWEIAAEGSRIEFDK